MSETSKPLWPNIFTKAAQDAQNTIKRVVKEFEANNTPLQKEKEHDIISSNMSTEQPTQKQNLSKSTESVVSAATEKWDQQAIVRLHGGEAQYQKLKELYQKWNKQLGEKKQEESSSVIKEIIEKEYQAVIRLYAGDQAEEKIKRISAEQRQNIINNIYNNLPDNLRSYSILETKGSKRLLSLDKFVSYLVIVNLSFNNKSSVPTDKEGLLELESLKDETRLKGKDISPLILSFEEETEESSNQEKKAEKEQEADTSTVKEPVQIEETSTSGEEQGLNKELQQEKQKALTLLQAFYQEQRHTSETHGKMQQYIKQMQDINQQVLSYMEKYCKKTLNYQASDFKVEANWHFVERTYDEIVLSWYSERHKERRAFHNSVNHLQKLQEKQANDEVLSNIIADYKTTETQILACKEKLWKEREDIIRDLLNIGYLKDLTDPQPQYECTQNHEGLYDVDGYIIVNIEFFKDSLKTSDVFYIDEKDNLDRLHRSIINPIKTKYNLTDEEINDLKRIQWSEEDRNKVSSLVTANQTLKKDLPETILKDYSELNLNTGDAEKIADLLRQATLKKIYQGLKLPADLEARVVAEIMIGLIP